MSLPIRFDIEAEEEFEAAADYYEERCAGLGVVFLNAVDDGVARLREGGPKLYTQPPGVAAELGVRRILLSKFPFSLVYLILHDEIRVLAVAHSAKRPGYWAGRL